MATGRRQGGDRKTTGKRQESGREATRSDREAIGRRQGRCAKPDEVEAEVEVVVVEVKLSVVVAGAMVEDGLGNMHNKW